MNLKTVKVLLFTLFSLALASLIIGCGVSKPVYFLFTALFAIGYAAVYLLCWRCPFCGERLGRSDGEICPHCGKSLLAPHSHQAGGCTQRRCSTGKRGSSFPLYGPNWRNAHIRGNLRMYALRHSYCIYRLVVPLTFLSIPRPQQRSLQPQGLPLHTEMLSDHTVRESASS